LELEGFETPEKLKFLKEYRKILEGCVSRGFKYEPEKIGESKVTASLECI
jgi:hypothetical protein